jgi:crotonobetainyl-CoA:carnitine CoA-transferase CaiB-like acyl-CoA transferase
MSGIVTVPDYGNRGSFEAVATPLDFSASTVGPQGPPPLLGEHTDAVLRELGVSDTEITALRARGVAR